MAKAKFIGVYASSKLPSSGKEQHSLSQKKKQYWFAWEDGWGRYCVQLLDPAFQPVEAARTITAEEFQQKFEHQPRILVTPVTQLEVAPSQKDGRGTIPQYDMEEKVTNMTSHLELDTGTINHQDDPVIMAKAAKVDQELRSEFAVALAKWRHGDRKSSLQVFEKMCTREDGIVPAHKHMFTDFAIDLRKSKLPDLALRHYQKAAELAPDDSYVHFNLARIYYEMKKIDKAEEQLQTALKLTPDFEFAQRFLNFLQEEKKKKTKS